MNLFAKEAAKVLNILCSHCFCCNSRLFVFDTRVASSIIFPFVGMLPSLHRIRMFLFFLSLSLSMRFSFSFYYELLLLRRVHLATFSKVNLLSSLTFFSVYICVKYDIHTHIYSYSYTIQHYFLFVVHWLSNRFFFWYFVSSFFVFLFGSSMKKVCACLVNGSGCSSTTLKLEEGNKIYLLNTQINLHKK